MDQGRRRQTRRPALLRNDRRGSARSVGVRNSCDHRRARGPPASSNPPGHHLHSGVDVIHHQKMQRSPDQERRAVGEQTLERTETGRAAPNVGGAQPNCGSSRSIPHDDRSSGRTPSTHGWRHASRDRTHRSARDWQRYVVGKVLLSSETARDPGAGAGGIAIKDRGSSCRGARYPSDHRTWRAAEERSVRNHRLQPPTLRVGSGVPQRQY